MQRFPDRYPGLLESSLPAGSRSFDILPMATGECLRLTGRRGLSGPHAAGASGFLDALQSWWRTLALPPSGAPAGGVPPGGVPPLPFTGGWLLYLGYELAAEVEPRLRLPPCPDTVSALAIRTPCAWLRDHATGEAWLVAEPGAEALLDRFAEHVTELGAGRTLNVAGTPETRAEFQISEEPPPRFLEAVARALEYIAAGEVYQANLSREWTARTHTAIDPTIIYARLRSANPSPFAAMLRYGNFALMSSSPERLLCIRDGIVATRPIAGTRPRGASAQTDRALLKALLENDKERAEHVMLIDLERNDLGRVCEGGTVRVDEFMVPETYAHVHHLVSNVSGRLRAGVSPVEVIRALFPGGTITGCPKVRCMEIIAELEGVGRGAYTGSLGYLNRDGSCDLNILIRTLTADLTPAADSPTLRLRAGAGIVADSNPQQELAETRAKAKGLLRALESQSGNA